MRVKWVRWAVLLLGALTFFVAGVLVWMNDKRAPEERITFLGYTNMANQEMAIFTIWEPKNLQRIGNNMASISPNTIVYTETCISGGWSFDNRSNLQAALRASGKTLTESARGLPVRVEKPEDTPERLLVAVPVSSAP